MIQVFVDTKVIEGKLSKLKANRDAARRESVAVLANEVVRFIITKAPRDTNRYVRGWQAAQNDISKASRTVGSVPLDTIRPSRYAAQILTRIRKQASYWTAVRTKLEQRAETYRSSGVKEGSPRMTRLLKSVEKVKEIERRARDMLRDLNENPDSATHAILIGGKKSLNPYTFGRLARSSRAFYGGYARMADIGGETFIEVKNLEPHANIVESRTRLMRSALSAVRGQGLKTVRGAYIKRLTENVSVMMTKGK